MQAEELADLKRRVEHLEEIVAQLCEQLAADDEDDSPLEDLDGNVIAREAKPGQFDTL